MPRRRPFTYESLRDLALSLQLPGVTEAMSWGQPCLKAHGKLWFFWSPSENAPVFKVTFEERDMLVESDPDTFFYTDHYRNHELVLAAPDASTRNGRAPIFCGSGANRRRKKLLKAIDAEF